MRRSRGECIAVGRRVPELNTLIAANPCAAVCFSTGGTSAVFSYRRDLNFSQWWVSSVTPGTVGLLQMPLSAP